MNRWMTNRKWANKKKVKKSCPLAISRSVCKINQHPNVIPSLIDDKPNNGRVVLKSWQRGLINMKISKIEKTTMACPTRGQRWWTGPVTPIVSTISNHASSPKQTMVVLTVGKGWRQSCISSVDWSSTWPSSIANTPDARLATIVVSMSRTQQVNVLYSELLINMMTILADDFLLGLLFLCQRLAIWMFWKYSTKIFSIEMVGSFWKFQRRLDS